MSTLIPAFVVVIRDLESLCGSGQSEIEALVAASEPHFVVSEVELFDLLDKSKFFDWHLFGAAYRVRCQLDIGISTFRQLESEEKVAITRIFEVATDDIARNVFVALISDT